MSTNLEAPPAPPPVRDRPAVPRRDRRVVLAIVGAPFALFFVVLAVRAAAVEWRPAQDFAIFQLRVGDVGTARTPLVGPYSRFGWNHPGPLLFWLLAPASRLLAGRPQGLLVGSVVVNAAAVAAALLLARRRGGTPLLLAVALVLVALIRSLGADLLLSPWNPWVTVLPTVVLLLLAWSIAVRDLVMLPAAVLVAAFVAQTHVAFVPLSAVVIGVAALVAWFGGSRPCPSARTTRRSIAAALVLFAVLWTPVAIDQVVDSRNASAIARHFTTERSAPTAWRTTAGIAAAELSPIGPWTTGPEVPAAFTGEAPVASPVWLLLPGVGLAAAAGITLRRRDRDGFALVVVAGAAAATVALSIRQITGPVWPYLVRFTWPVAAVVWLAIGRAIAPPVVAALRRRWAPRFSPDRVAVPSAVATALVSLVVLGSIGPWGASPPDPDQSADVARIVAAVERAVPLDRGIVVVRPADTTIRFPAPDARGSTAGVVAALDERGVDARVAAEDWTFDDGQPILAGPQLFGSARIDDGGPIAGTVTIVSAPALETFVAPPGSIEIDRVGDPADLAEMRALESELARAFTDAGHPDAVERIADDRLRWVGFDLPDLGRSADQIDRLLTLRARPREAVYWHPGR